MRKVYIHKDRTYDGIGAQYIAISDCGDLLSSHFCSNDSFAKSDLGMYKENDAFNVHEKYKAYFKEEPYEVVFENMPKGLYTLYVEKLLDTIIDKDELKRALEHGGWEPFPNPEPSVFSTELKIPLGEE